MSIQVRDITHIYSEGLPYETVALKDVSFDVDDGQFVGIIGHTGSGKSTLLQHLNGLLKPKSGTIVVSGTDITADNAVLRDIRRKVGLVFQYPEYQLFEETVLKDVSFGPKNLGLEEDEIEERAVEAIRLVGLDPDEFGDRSPFELSGGQKRRVAIAGVLAMKPEVLILDEPTAGLDPKAHRDILEMIKDVHQKEKNITILVSHNMNDIAALSDKILVMENGGLAMEGSPAEIFAESGKLKEMGLGVPEITDILVRLKDRGFDIRQDIFSVDEAIKAIVEKLGGGE
ncbi:MAG: energy-coupling factor transporter ATPase [Firmicutes bacterium]|nr:energy-coupling factor transporter ATPase [Bacillota bacterium]